MDFIYFVLFVIFTVTIISMFLKPIIKPFLFNSETIRNDDDDFGNVYNPEFLYHKLFCPVTGYKCENSNCDCKELCGNNFQKYIVTNDQKNLYLSTLHLEPGTYCLPQKSSNECNQYTSYNVYNLQGWSCISKYPHLFAGKSILACKSNYAKNNNDNFLWDNLLKSEVKEMQSDPFERDGDKYRFECKCHSLDYMNNPMKTLKLFPFTCVSDYCLRNIYQAADAGYNEETGNCECNSGMHEFHNDPTSACIPSLPYNPNIIASNHSCYTENSFLNEKHFPCPDNYKSNTVNQIRYQKGFYLETFNPVTALLAI